CPEGRLMHPHGLFRRQPDLPAALPEALLEGHRAVAFDDRIGIESGPREMAVDVGREDELFVVPLSEQCVPRMRLGPSIEVRSMAIEAPGKRWIATKPDRIGDLLE